MKATPTTEFIHEGPYAAKVSVMLMEDDHAWAPYFSIEDVRKLEAVRRALQSGDIAAAAKLARIYEMKPIAAE